MKTAALFHTYYPVRRRLVAGLCLLLFGAAFALDAHAQSNSCAETTGLPLIAKFEVNGAGHFVFEEGTPGIISISNIQTKPGEPNEPISGDFTSTLPVSAVYVKSGGDEKTDAYAPPVLSGSFDNDGNGMANSTVSFCLGQQSDLECKAPAGGDRTSITSVNTTDPARNSPSNPPLAGDVLKYRFTVKNAGSVAASGVVVKVYYPDAFAFDSAPGGSNTDPSGSTFGAISYAVGTLASGATETVMANLEVLPGGGTQTFTVAFEVFGQNEFDATSTAGNLLSGGQPSLNFEDDECAAPTTLPVELTTFTAQLDGTDLRLDWQTASETNNAGFEVQHRAPGAAAFETAAFVAGAGTTIEAQRYSHRLVGLAPGTHRVRLKQLDYDGSFEYSAELEVSVELPSTHVVSAVYPNPFNPEARLSVGVQRAQQVEVSLYDALGRQVRVLFAGRLEAAATRSVVVDGRGLRSGTYLLRVVGETFAETQTLTLVK